ncbi:MAG: tyrosine-type recombinase/integrase [Pseudomonadota bacterium]
MPKVSLKGLNIRQSKGKWYVSWRTGGSLIRGFEGTRKQLETYMSGNDFLSLYLASEAAPITKQFPQGSVGQVIEWYKEHTQRWADRKPRTKKDYQQAFDWLGEELNYPVELLTPADIATVRNKAALEKYPKFADHLVSALSSVFSEAAEAGLMASNPCSGVKRVYKAKKNANREWMSEEEAHVFDKAPPHLLTIMLIAREASSRGQDIHSLKWSNYDGNRLHYTARKNDERISIPVSSRLKDHLDGLERHSVNIITTSRNRPYKSEKVMQDKVSEFLTSLKNKDEISKELTLHGLRVTLAAELKRQGEDDRTIADAIGDRSATMGAHYTRHVERETNVVKAFGRREKGCAK